MECTSCGNDKAYGLKIAYTKYGRFEECDRCGQVSNVGIADVYWKGPGYHPGILDKDNKPIFLESRGHKARLMKEMGLREAGDTHHGKRGTETLKVEEFHRNKDLKSREVVRREAQRIRELLPQIPLSRIPGPERQAFLRIVERSKR